MRLRVYNTIAASELQGDVTRRMKHNDARWVVIYMAHSKERADAVSRMLTDEGFLIQTQAVDGEPDAACHEVLALTSEAREARDLLQENGY